MSNRKIEYDISRIWAATVRRIGSLPVLLFALTQSTEIIQIKVIFNKTYIFDLFFSKIQLY